MEAGMDGAELLDLPSDPEELLKLLKALGLFTETDSKTIYAEKAQACHTCPDIEDCQSAETYLGCEIIKVVDGYLAASMEPGGTPYYSMRGRYGVAHELLQLGRVPEAVRELERQVIPLLAMCLETGFILAKSGYEPVREEVAFGERKMAKDSVSDPDDGKGVR